MSEQRITYTAHGGEVDWRKEAEQLRAEVERLNKLWDSAMRQAANIEKSRDELRKVVEGVREWCDREDSGTCIGYSRGGRSDAVDEIRALLDEPPEQTNPPTPAQWSGVTND